MKNIILCFVLSLLCAISGESIKKPSEFLILTSLYSHNLWTIDEHLNISLLCSRDLNVYLGDLNESKLYALKVSDASGRYRGDFLMKNYFWLGSKISCKEIDKVVDSGFSFYVANILVKLNMLQNDTKLLQLGQCLPKSCSTQDVGKILDNDPNVKLFRSSFGGKFHILKIRNVPGNYQLLMDHKFIYFM